MSEKELFQGEAFSLSRKKRKGKKGERSDHAGADMWNWRAGIGAPVPNDTRTRVEAAMRGYFAIPKGIVRGAIVRGASKRARARSGISSGERCDETRACARLDRMKTELAN